MRSCKNFDYLFTVSSVGEFVRCFLKINDITEISLSYRKNYMIVIFDRFYFSKKLRVGYSLNLKMNLFLQQSQ